MLNFKDWKLSSQDGTKATLKHANGHEMTIAMKALPKIQREQIMRLAKAAQVQKLDEGTPETIQGDTTNAGAPTQQPAAVVVPAKNPAAAYQDQPVVVQVPNVIHGVSNINPDGTLNPEAIAKNTQQNAEDTGKLAAVKSAAEVPVESGYARGAGQAAAIQQDLINQMKRHNDDFAKYINSNPINPNAYVEGMEPAKRTLTGLGLILGGVGAGQLGSTDNPALRFLNNQIDRDIAGQQARVNNQRTVLGAYQDLYGQGTAANNLTKASLLDIYNHKLQLIANQLGTPTARLAANKFAVDAGLEKSKLIQDAAVEVSNLPGARATNMDIGKNTPKAALEPAAGGITTQELQAMHEKQGSEPQAAGIPSEGGSSIEKHNPLDTAGDNNQILHPDAEHRLNKLRYGAPKDRQDFDMARAQYDQAFNADQQLKQVNGLYKRLYGETNGIAGRMHRGINPHALAAGAGALGTAGGMMLAGPAGAVAGGTALGALGEGIGHGLQAVTNTGANQEYDRDLEALKGIISASLKNRGDMTVEEAVQKFAPTDRDTPEQAMKKREAFKEFITSHIDKGIISLHGIAQRHK